MKRALLIALFATGCTHQKPVIVAAPASHSFEIINSKGELWVCARDDKTPCYRAPLPDETPSPPPPSFKPYCNDTFEQREQGRPCATYKISATRSMIYARYKDPLMRKFWYEVATHGMFVTDSSAPK